MRKIIFVSRLDFDCSLGAYLLCNIAPILAKKYDDLQIIIVGGGTEYKKISSKSKHINSKFNRELIILTGKLENPSEIFDKGAIFVGVSRAALEAMAHGLPVILLGNEGYLGLLNEKNLNFAQKTNFTCRGAIVAGEISMLQNKLATEIFQYFDLSQDDKESLANFSLQVVKNGYTARQMAQKTLDFYNQTINDYQKKHARPQSCHSKIAICGYYGRGNLGDEAILSVILQKLRGCKPDAHIYIIRDKNPIKILATLWGTDIFIFGGGSLLQNSTSNFSLLYYLAIIKLARVFCKRTIMLSNGIGPIECGLLSRNTLLKMIASTIKTFDFLSVRDLDSQNLLSEILPQKKIHFIPDPVLTYEEEINRKLIRTLPKSYFIFIPCYNGLEKAHISSKKVAFTLDFIEKTYGISPMLVLLNPKDDLAVAKSIASHLTNVKIECPTTPDKLFLLLQEAEFVISQRYHGTLFAAMCEIPTLSVSNDPKMHSLCKDLSLFPSQDVDIFKNPKHVFRKILSAVDHEKVQKNTIHKKIIARKNLSQIMMTDSLK